MREINILLSMLNQAPASARKHLPAMTMRYGEVEVARDNPSYHWVNDNPAAAHFIKLLHERVKTERGRESFTGDKLQQPIEQRHAQQNINAVQHCISNLDVPYKSNATLYRIRVAVPGHEDPVSKGHRWSRSHDWDVKVPITYYKNVKQVNHVLNEVHTVTSDGVKWLNFITKYNQITSADPSIKLFSCEVNSFNPNTGVNKDTTGYYAEQDFDDDVLSAFAYSEKRALSLLNKRVKAAMLSKLGVA